MFEPLRVPPSPALRQWCREHGYSPELVARWGAFYPDLKGLLAALDRAPSTFMRLNSLRAPPEETLARLRDKGFRLAPTSLPHCVRVDESPFSAGATTEYLHGRYFLQDLSSQLAPLALAPRPGHRVADLCAAPGGKTVALADLMQNGGTIGAFEKEPDRYGSLVANLARCGVLNTISWPRRGQDAAKMQEAFDAVLVDAPCTGEGVIQRDPRRKLGQLREYAECAAEQADLLAAAARALRPGGTLLYATCTLAPEENELQVERAVNDLGFVIEDLPAQVRELRLEGRALEPGLTRVAGRDLDPDLAKTAHALPHLHGCLGFYLARLRKEAS